MSGYSRTEKVNTALVEFFFNVQQHEGETTISSHVLIVGFSWGSGQEKWGQNVPFDETLRTLLTFLFTFLIDQRKSLVVILGSPKIWRPFA